MKSLCLFFLLCLSALAGKAQNQPEQNCINGISVCQSGYSQTNTYIGPGTLIELNSTNQGCLGTGEVNCVWYIIQVSVTGQLALSITPNNLANDYDFAVWNITANGCQDIYNGTLPVACNFSGATGVTGLSGTASPGSQFSPAITVTAGQVLALNISNYSQTNQSGYVLDFTASTASIFDNVTPRFSAAYVPCGLVSDSVDVTLSESVKCASIQANGSNFLLLSGAPGTVVPPGTTILSATSLSCTSPTSLTRSVRLKFSSMLPAGTYLLKPKLGTSGTTIQDACSNNIPTGATADSVTFSMTLPLSKVYVDSSVAVSGTGASWASPMKSVTQALNFANAACVNEIWVRKGTYYPLQSNTAVAGSRDSSFRILRNGIRLYGGFAGNETALSQRNIAANPTVLSGDIGVIEDSTDNCYHVVTVVSTNTNIIGNSTYIDGFEIRKGNANAGGTLSVAGLFIERSNGGGVYNFAASPSITNCTFSSNSSRYTGGNGGYGGGMYNNTSSAPLVTNCTFSSNVAGNFGGGMYNIASSPAVTNCTFAFNTGGGMYTINASPSVTNCIFYSNSSNSYGGGMYNNQNSSTAVTNCTFASNSATFGGGGMFNASGSPVIKNGILWGNTSGSGTSDDLLNYPGSTPAISYTTAGTTQTGIGNSTANPLFVNAANALGPDGIWGTSDDGLRLTTCSGAINTGSNAAIPAGITTDITGALRIQNTTVDKGAYEMPYNATGISVTTISMTPANPVCSNTGVTFTATTTVLGSLPAYQWYKNGVAVGINQATYTFGSWGNNDSVWVVHTNNNCGVTDTSSKRYVQAIAVPAQPGAIAGNTSPCPGTHIYSVSAVTGATGYAWTVPAGWVITAGQGTPSVTVTSTSASGNITVTATNACPVVSAVRTLMVTSLTAPAIPTGPVAVCESSTGNVYTIPAALGATSYSWTVPAGWVITAGQGTTSITVTAAPGNTSGSITVSANNGCQTGGGGAALTVTGNGSVPMLIVGTNTGNTICQGTPVVFTASPINGGTAPVYQWKKNGVNVGTNSATYVDAALANGDIVTVLLTSNSPCAAGLSATALGPAITVTPSIVPAITISGPSVLTLCAGVSNTFTASSSNGGASPTYQWYNNGAVIPGATAASYTGSNFANNDAISVLLTSNATCRSVDTVRSSNVVLSVYSNGSPTVIVGSNSGNTVCAGTLVTFTAALTNSGTLLSYQWKKNGVNVGTNSITYSSAALVTGDVITVTVTSSSPCATTASVTAIGPPITVLPFVTPAIAINGPTALTLCAGASNIFLSTSNNGGPGPGYQWYRKGVAIPGANTAAYTGSGFASNDAISVRLTSNATCRSVDTARSSSVVLTVTPNVVPVLTVTANPGTSIPTGTSVTFTANITVAGQAATYQWYKNGVAIAGATNSIYTTNTLQGGDLIWVQVAALGPCATPNNLTSTTFRITRSAGIQTVSGSGGWPESLLLHPNPNSGRFTVSADWGAVSAGEKVQVEVVNGLGQWVFSKEMTLTAGKWSLEVQLNEGVANGLYMLRVNRQKDGSMATKPVLIQR